MILCIYEGPRENKWFQPLSRLFLKEDVIEYFIVEGTFHVLYKILRENNWDVIEALRDIDVRRGEHKLLDYRESDFSEVYLFFDYDPHSSKSLELLNSELAEMLTFFDNETEHGKLYVNYPMIEALRYTKKLPDKDFHTYTINIDRCGGFKSITSSFSSYANNNFIEARGQVKEDEAISNWNLLKEQNVCKANYICHGDNKIPTSKSAITQLQVFQSQLSKYVLTENPCVSILAAYPLFLYDYFK